MGFWGAEVPLPHSHFDGEEGLRARYPRIPARQHRESVGPGFPLMVDCYMSLTVALRASACAEACQGPRYPLVGGGSLTRRRRGLPPDQGGPADAQMDYRRARIHPLRHAPSDRGAQPRHHPARRDVGWRPDREACSRSPPTPAAYDMPDRPAWQRAILLPLHRQPDRRGVLRIRRLPARTAGIDRAGVRRSQFEGEPVPQHGKLKPSRPARLRYGTPRPSFMLVETV